MDGKEDLPSTEEKKPQAKVNLLEEKIDAVLNNWVNSTYRNSPISRDTSAYNHLRSRLPDLKSALIKELKK